MASNRASTSRYSLDDWDSLAPLSPAQTASVHRISLAAQHKPLPAHLQRAQDSSPRPSTPLARTQRSRFALDSPSGSPRPGSARGLPAVSKDNGTAAADDADDPLALDAPIASAQQFHDWFSRVEHSLEREQESVYREHLDELVAHLATCDDVLGGLDEARGLLSEMEANYRYVDENSRALQLACETMLDEQKHLLEVTEAIGARLEYFRELEKATRMLNLPGEDLVLQDDFLNMLDRLDVCLDYLKANRDFRDAEIYLIRFQQCLTRSMTLIKMYFVTTIRKIATDAQEKMTGKELSDTALHALLYAKFSNAAPTLRILLYELEKRAQADPSEYGSLLSECYAAWFSARSTLLAPSLAEEVRRMDPGASELVKLAKAGCAYLRGVCAMEWGLYREFFASGSDEAYRFLESLCDHLYDSLRPRILHEPRLDALCELCAVLYALMALDSSSLPSGAAADFDDDDDVGEVGAEGAVVPTRAQSTMRFAVLLQTILQDAQTRLVFRAQAVVQSDVLHYVPSAADLEYPEKLVHEDGKTPPVLWDEDELEVIGGSGGAGEDGAREGKGRFRVPREGSQKTWFPTLRKTVWVLARLNTYVNDAIFEDFAGEAVTLCRQSLATASAQIAARPADAAAGESASTRRADGQLFLVRHLLLLKEMVRSVDLVHVERGADFSSVTEALSTMLRNTSTLFNPRALVELASKGLPSFAETMTDAKTDLDGALKKACEDLISSSSASLTFSLRTFLDRCTSFLSSPSPAAPADAAPRDLPAQEWAAPEKVLELHGEFQRAFEEQARAVVRRMRLYLVEEKTVTVLLPPLWEDVVDTYSTFYNLVRSEYGFATSSSLVAPAEVRERLEKAAKADA
ncbi:Golgi transport complex subunit COG3 [Rhodotorula paludigena]|uniref:Golgi transport complex subunit COG3 n=1 Tax=Rhodotorula paludigena TaxID=86838 RepID=UPI00317E0770